MKENNRVYFLNTSVSLNFCCLLVSLYFLSWRVFWNHVSANSSVSRHCPYLSRLKQAFMCFCYSLKAADKPLCFTSRVVTVPPTLIVMDIIRMDVLILEVKQKSRLLYFIKRFQIIMRTLIFITYIRFFLL